MRPIKLHWPVVVLLLLCGGCGQDEALQAPPMDSATEPKAAEVSAPVSSVTYTVVEESVSDTPIKTQIEQHVVASGVPTKSELEAEIRRRYREATARRGFRYHDAPTNIYIYVYGNEEQASAGQGLWIGMLSMGPLDKEGPSFSIDDDRFAALSRKPEVRLRLPEEQRKEIFRSIAAAERRASKEAMASIPDSQIMKQITLERELGDKYKAALQKQHGLSDDQLIEIMTEGVTSGWPH